MEDHFDALTELTFTNIRFNTLPTDNPQVRQSLLQLDLTPGTDIIRQ
jgi:outer membrane lipoprotein carrier protein